MQKILALVCVLFFVSACSSMSVTERETKRSGLDEMAEAAIAGRMVAEVFLDGGVSLADKIISQGLGREYHDGKREGWCPVDNVQETHIRKCAGGKESASRNSNLICGTA
jgi:hypothetical protein